MLHPTLPTVEIFEGGSNFYGYDVDTQIAVFPGHVTVAEIDAAFAGTPGWSKTRAVPGSVRHEWVRFARHLDNCAGDELDPDQDDDDEDGVCECYGYDDDREWVANRATAATPGAVGVTWVQHIDA